MDVQGSEIIFYIMKSVRGLTPEEQGEARGRLVIEAIGQGFDGVRRESISIRYMGFLDDQHTWECRAEGVRYKTVKQDAPAPAQAEAGSVSDD